MPVLDIKKTKNQHKKRISSTPIFNSSSKPDMEEFVEYAVDGDNFSIGSLGCEQFEKYERKETEKESECLSEKNPCLIESKSFERKEENSFVDSLVNYGDINMDEKEERQIAHFRQDGESMRCLNNTESLAYLCDVPLKIMRKPESERDDARSRAAYEYFAEVISFDMTYNTNKYNMVFGSFVGVNPWSVDTSWMCFDEK
ncbi:hypothetical protein Ahy_A05g024193 [Arachis hypogaea]|uniref:Protein FAR1-RELATED SEQUENCE n=1 Tax=Arachis hypogaea TaxID=3818 RepID=A0A445D5C3_ARAHY|nr:hypothetical protein Ahy_A05g024193 [Arachis hypogaea]